MWTALVGEASVSVQCDIRSKGNWMSHMQQRPKGVPSSVAWKVKAGKHTASTVDVLKLPGQGAGGLEAAGAPAGTVKLDMWTVRIVITTKMTTYATL